MDAETKVRMGFGRKREGCPQLHVTCNHLKNKPCLVRRALKLIATFVLKDDVWELTVECNCAKHTCLFLFLFFFLFPNKKDNISRFL